MSAARSAPPPDVRQVLDLADAAWADLEVFRARLEEANARMNLVGGSTLADFWRRHVLDSAQLTRLAPDARRWVDIGSGAGFPGLVLAILMKGVPGAGVGLVESRERPCAFLEAVAAELDLPATVWRARAESLVPWPADIVTARACAPLERLLGYAAGFLAQGARGLFLKGERWAEEAERARRRWRFELRAHPSLADPRGQIVEIGSLARA